MVRRLFLLLVCLATTLAGCSEQPREGIRFGVQQLPLNFDPRQATDAASERVNHLLYRGLVRFDETRLPQPDLATWQRPEPRRYRFTLEADSRFDDGSAVTVRDVLATYDAILDPENNSPHRSTLSIIEEMRPVDGSTIDFLLARADPYFPSYLVTGILPAERIANGHDFSSKPIGSGPFRLKERDAGRLLLERKSDGEILSLLLVKEPSVRVLKLLRGEIDLLQGDLPPSLVDYLSAQEGVRVRTAHGSNYTYLGFNLEDPVTGDVRIRRAIAHAIDREAIIRHVFKGRARKAAGLFPPEHALGIADETAIRFDPQQAMALLREAGYGPSRPLELTWKTSSDPFRLRLATIMQQQLADAGIRVTIKSHDFGTFFGDIKSGNFQLYSLTWVGLKTPDSFRYIFHSGSIPPNGANRGRYRSSPVDRLIESAEKEVDIDAQVPFYQRLQRQLLQDLPYIPLWYEDQMAAYRPGAVSDYVPRQDGNYDGLTGLARVGR
ncbi:MAG: ABC transporter substrate-binding protein [Gammaproteobacteria bacterium]